jgi:hypothetical protein
MEIREPAILELVDGRKRTILRWETRAEGLALAEAIIRKSRELPDDGTPDVAVVKDLGSAPEAGPEPESSAIPDHSVPPESWTPEMETERMARIDAETMPVTARWEDLGCPAVADNGHACDRLQGHKNAHKTLDGYEWGDDEPGDGPAPGLMEMGEQVTYTDLHRQDADDDYPGDGPGPYYVRPGAGPRCGDHGADGAGWTCSAQRGHGGDHSAYGPGGELYRTWPKGDGEPLAATAPIRRLDDPSGGPSALELVKSSAAKAGVK